MGYLFIPVATRPIPKGAEIVGQNAERIARWRTARGGAQTAPVRTTPSGERVAIPGRYYYARFKDGLGVTRTVPTRCKDQDAARAVLVGLERRAERVRSGLLSPAEDAAADHRRSDIGGHMSSYLASLRARGDGERHVRNIERLATTVIAECRIRSLAEVKRETIERWLITGKNATRSARTRNMYLGAVRGLMRWCVEEERVSVDPTARIRRADEKADRRRQPRALTPDELQRLLDAAKRRPLDEASRFNRGWRKGRRGARLRPQTRTKLEALGHERALAYRVLILTGLRLGELRAIRVGDVMLDAAQPHIALDARHEKARRGATIPLRPDLADDLRRWIGDRKEGRLFRISPNQVKVFDRDLRFAGIAKRDDRGRVACIHALRHSFGTLMARSAVPPRVAQAAMRHSSIDLTMSVYTDPRLLDVAAALDQLPALPLGESPDQGQPSAPTPSSRAI